MRIRLFIVLALVLGLLMLAPARSRLLADQRDSTVVDEPCVQDFPNATAPDPRVTVVMCGLDNPRGLAFFEPDQRNDWRDGDDGRASDAALYVAEAGRGATDPTTSTQCFTGQAGMTALNRCYGATGAISRLWKGVQKRVVQSLPSHANRMGRQAIGPHDIAFMGGHRDDDRRDRAARARTAPRSRECDPVCAYVTIGLQQPPGFRRDFPFLRDFAQLLRIPADGRLRYVADLGTYKMKHNPNHSQLDTNPYGLLAEPGGDALVAVDAGGNSMLRIGESGKVSTLAFFPRREDDSVPTSIAVGPDGAYYVGELTGFPLVPGAANIYRVSRGGESPEVCLTGFTAIIDIAFDGPGDLYVLEYTGTLFRVARDRTAARDWHHQRDMCSQYEAGARTKTTVLSGLTDPTSVAVGPDGALYISNRGSFPGTGQVLRFEPLEIAFTRLREDVRIPGSDERLEAEIWVMNGDGSEPRRLTHNLSADRTKGVDDLGAVWSPDGRTIAFYGTPFERNAAGTIVVTGPPRIALIDADGGEERFLVNGRFPNWSPNGRRIAFDSSGAASNIFTIDPDGTDLTQLTELSGRNIRPAWSPDGRKIAFARGPNENEEIWVMNADGSEQRQLTSNAFSDNAPDWSPDGRQIVFQTDRDGNDEIYVMNADGTGEPRRLTDFPGRDLDADWSPDGRTIVFQRDIEPIEDLILQVFVMNADGTHVRQLTALPSENGHPGWGREREVMPRSDRRK